MRIINHHPPGPLAVAVLALLHEEPMHPYQMSFTMRQRHWDWAIKLKFGSLYHTVDALLRDGLIQPLATARAGRRPERTVYAVTERGRQAFLDRLSQMVLDPVRDYTDFAAGLKFLGHLDQNKAVTLLRGRAELLEQNLAYVDSVIRMLTDERRLRRLSRLELDHAQAMSRAEVRWIKELAAEIESGELEWKAGHEPAESPLKEAK